MLFRKCIYCGGHHAGDEKKIERTIESCRSKWKREQLAFAGSLKQPRQQTGSEASSVG